MEYLTTAEAGKKWNISKRRAAILCEEGRVSGAVKIGNTWMIPFDSSKPSDMRRRDEKGQSSTEYFPYVLATLKTLDIEKADSEEMKTQLASELALFNGDPVPALLRYHTVTQSNPFYFCAAMAAMSAAVVNGSYDVFSNILEKMKRIADTEKDKYMRRRAWLVYTTATVSMNASDMGEEWAENTDFSDISEGDTAWVIYIRSKIRANALDLKGEIDVCESALALYKSRNNIAALYLNLSLAAAAYSLGDNKRGERAMKNAIAIARPYGMLVPFSESASHYGEGLHTVFSRCWPKDFEKMDKLSKKITDNWITVHNRFTSDNLTLLLSIQEYRLAKYLVLHYSYKQIADLMHYSEGSIRNRISLLYTKLSIKSRKELEKLIWK